MLEHCTELVGQRRGLSLGRRGDPGERRWCGRTLSVVAVAGTGEAWIPFRGAAGRTPTPGLGVGGAAMTRADGLVSEPGKVVHAGTGSQQSGSGPAGLSLSATTVGGGGASWHPRRSQGALGGHRGEPWETRGLPPAGLGRPCAHTARTGRSRGVGLGCCPDGRRGWGPRFLRLMLYWWESNKQEEKRRV